VPNVVGSSEGWKLFISTGVVLVGYSNIQLQVPRLPTTLSTYLSRIMTDSLMMAF
jgi:hypothetical protein